jgi:CRP-like cAMP-binding protein
VSLLLERVLMLKESAFFGGVATDDLRVVARELGEERYFAGDRIFDINDPSDRLFIIDSGKIGISIHPDPKVAEFITVLGERDCFGEMGILEDLPRSATAHVVADSKLLVLERSKLTGLLTSYPQLSIGILRSLSARLREANRKLI